MHRSTTRWTTAAAVAALLAVPVAGSAQTTGTTPQQPPAQPQPQPQPQPQNPTQPQPQSPTTSAEQPAASGQVDANAAKKHLSDARDSLSQLTSLPEAAKLQGDARTQVSQLIANFNELITTQSDWRSAYTKLDANLTSLLGPDSADATAAADKPVGTSGAGAANLDPAIRTKLAEVRSHLKLFEKAAGGTIANNDAAASTGAMAPSAATGASASPANPTATPANPDPAAASPTSPSQPPSSAGAMGTSGVTPSSPTTSMAREEQAKAESQVNQAAAAKELDAINEILTKSKTGALTRAQTTELKKHVETLRTLLKSGR